jgi:hypothetical protein
LEKTELAAGDSARLEVIFNSGKIKRTTRKVTRIFSNDSTDSVTPITIAADVRPEPYSSFSVQVSPAIAEFGQKGEGEDSELDILIENKTSQDLGIKIVDLPSDFLDGKLWGQTIKPSREVKLKIKLTDEAKKASFTKSITLELDDPSRSRLTIPVKR